MIPRETRAASSDGRCFKKRRAAQRKGLRTGQDVDPPSCIRAEDNQPEGRGGQLPLKADDGCVETPGCSDVGLIHWCERLDVA